MLHVLPRKGGTSVPATPAIDHFAFNASDLPAYEEKLRAAGQDFTKQRLADSEFWQIVMSDPDGVQVESTFFPPKTEP